MTVKHWNTGAAAARFRIQAASNKRQASSRKRQASSVKRGGPAHNQAPDFVKKKI